MRSPAKDVISSSEVIEAYIGRKQELDKSDRA